MTDNEQEKYIDYNHHDARRCWAKGFYWGQLFDCHVKQTKEKTDRDTGEIIAPRPMLEIVIKVYNGNRTQLISDYVVPGTETVEKLKQLARALGHETHGAFLRNEFQPADHLAARDRQVKQFVVFLGVEESEEYGDANKIQGYSGPEWQPKEKHRLAGYAMPDFPVPGVREQFADKQQPAAAPEREPAF